MRLTSMTPHRWLPAGGDQADASESAHFRAHLAESDAVRHFRATRGPALVNPSTLTCCTQGAGRAPPRIVERRAGNPLPVGAQAVWAGVEVRRDWGRRIRDGKGESHRPRGQVLLATGAAHGVG